MCFIYNIKIDEKNKDKKLNIVRNFVARESINSQCAIAAGEEH